MKNNIIGVFIAIFILPLVSCPMITSATTPTFQTQEEIDAYYDAQKIQNKENYEQKVQGIKDQLEIDLENLHKETEAKKLEAQRKIFGENFEIIKPFLPESNPDPEAIYLDLLKNPTQNGVSRIKILMLYNPELAEKVHLIMQREIANTQKRITEGEAVIFKTKEKIQKEESQKGTTIKNSSITITPSIIKEDKNILSSNIIEEKVIKPEPVVKVRWYQKIFNWFKKN
jgi:hypothetical protein